MSASALNAAFLILASQVRQFIFSK